MNEANTAFNSDYSGPSKEQAGLAGKHIRWVSDSNEDHVDDEAEMEKDGRECWLLSVWHSVTIYLFVELYINIFLYKIKQQQMDLKKWIIPN